MADDINLPNLVSHLAVNLDGVSGAVSDATRQGSAMGSALGNGIHRQLDDLLRHLPQVQIDGNSDPIDRDLARIHRQLAELDAQRIGVDISIPDALRQLEELETNLQRIGDEHHDVNVRAATAAAARQLEELRDAARRVDDTDVDIDVDVDVDRPNRLTAVLGRLSTVATAAGPALAGVGTAAAGIGAAVPIVASVVSTLANVAPAAGVAVSGMAAVQLASGAVKLAAVGMDDALSAALDPSKAAEFNEALKKLSPEARKFATAVRDVAPALREAQQAVQNEVFRGLADELERTGRSVLPILRTNLVASGRSLNAMAKDAAGAARELADNGTLGKALGSASKGLNNLSGIPGIVVTSLGQIAAAAGPSFERLTAGAAKAATGIGDKLSKAFESGQMQEAIETAIDLIGDLLEVGQNVASIFSSIFSAAQTSGGGLIETLRTITGALAEAFASPEVQGGLTALFSTMSTLASTAAPLLGQALAAVAPVLEALGPPAQTLIKNLGEGLSPVIDALGPVLAAAAGAVGALVEAAAPLLPVVGQLAAALLPALTPLLEAARVTFEALAPVVAEVAGILQETLAPILANLPGIIQPLAELLGAQLVTYFQILGDLLVEVGPSLVTLGESFGELIVAATPLITLLAQMTAELLEHLVPAMTPVIGLVGDLARIFSGSLAIVINDLVIPALQVLTALLSGDTSAAADTAGRAMSGLNDTFARVWTTIVSFVQQKISEVVAWIAGLPGRASAALSGLAGSLSSQASRAGAQLVSAVRGKLDEAISWIRGLPGRAASVLSGLGGVLVSAGASLISGFISGIASKIPSVQSTLQGLTSKLTDWKGPKARDAKILTPAGRLLIQGFIKGINAESTSKLKSRLESITRALPDNVRRGVGKTLAKATADLEKLVGRRDAVVKKLAAAEKKLADLVKARSKAASDIREGILNEANITTGHADVNSVSAITVGLQQALKNTKAFQANITKLRKAGLRSDLLQQIADAGVEAGGATAAALAKATPAELKKINDLQAQLSKSATATGNTVGDALYTAGIRAAQGLVAGLKSQEKAIEATMRKIAENMLKTVKKAHKTKSPSREFRWLGEMDGEGLRVGLLASVGRVRAAARSMAGAALDVASGVGGALAATPSAAQLSAVYARGGGGDRTYNINLYGSDATPAGIVRELSWLGLVGRG